MISIIYNAKLIESITALLIFLFILLIFPSHVESHPLDVTNLYVNIQNEQVIEGIVRIGWVQMAAIESELLKDISIQTIERYDGKIIDYLDNNLSFTTDVGLCNVEYLGNYDEEFETIIITGMSFDLLVTCPENYTVLKHSNSLFTENFPDQKNNVSIYDGDQVVSLTTLGTKIKEVVIESKDGDFGKLDSLDTGRRREIISFKKISEHITEDSYTAILSILSVSFIIGLLHALEGGHSKMILASLVINKKADMKTSFRYLTVFTISHMSDLFLFGIILLIAGSSDIVIENTGKLATYAGYGMFLICGFILFREIHTLYSKDILKDHQLIDRILINLSSLTGRDFRLEKVRNREGHLINRTESGEESICKDNKHYELLINESACNDQVKNRDELEIHHEHKHMHNILDDGKINRSELAVAFLAGLAPCLTGWALILLIVQSEKYFLLLPVSLSFGLGIFLTLSIFLYMVHKLNRGITNRFETISKYSPLISAMILFVLSLYAIL